MNVKLPMKLKLLTIGGITLFGILLGAFFYTQPHHQEHAINACPFEVKKCSDGTGVTRVGKDCAFAKCPNEVTNEVATLAGATTTPLPVATTTHTVSTSTIELAGTPEHTATMTTLNQVPSTPTTLPSHISAGIVASITSSISSFVHKVITTVTPEKPQGIISYLPTPSSPIPPSTYITSSSSPDTHALPPSDFAGEKYLVQDGNILSNDNKVVYTISGSSTDAMGTTTDGWTNTTVNAVPINNIAPILNAIPITDLPGKYYVSENSFGNKDACEFSNKIFILDTVTGSTTLLYEENSSTLSIDDPRACTSEIFLLATENNKLVLKYHTLGTNTSCDSAWSEPDKTYYLTVTNLSQGMTKYTIPDDLSNGAEAEEEACRAKL